MLIGKRTDHAPDLAVFRDELAGGGAGPEMVIIPAGTFMMGSDESEAELGDDDKAYPDEIVAGKGKHEVRIARRFALGRYPVTFEEYDAFLAATAGTRQRDAREAGDEGWGRGRRGAGYRLPSEAEWEYACRAGTTTRRWWGDAWDPARANGTDSFEGGKTSPAGHYASNSWGLFDTIGNVWEWCEDAWHDSYEGAPADGTARTTGDSSRRVVRGGSWGGNPRNLRAAARSTNFDLFLSGFRVGRMLTS